MSAEDDIRDFLSGKVYAVAGASRDRSKYGNKVLRAYLQAGKRVYAVHPKEREIEGVAAVPDLASLPEKIDGLSIVTPPAITEAIVADAIAAGVRRIWMQPGAESHSAIADAEAHGLTVIAGGPCLLVAAHYRE